MKIGSYWQLVGVVCLLAACSKPPAMTESIPNVWVVHASAGDIPSGMALTGEVRAREESPLAFRVGGKVIQRHVDAGSVVKQGQLLAEIDMGDLSLQSQAAQAQLAAAEADLVRTRDELTRYTTLEQKQLISRSALDAQRAAFKAAQAQVNAAKAQRDVAQNQTGYTQLRAPRAGVIASRQVEAGQVIAAGQTAFVLATEAGRDVVVSLPENQVQQVRIGQAVQIQLWSSPDDMLSGSVREISPMADPATRTFMARIAVDNASISKVELGQSARVYIADAEQVKLHLPLSAIQQNQQQQTAVWVVDPQKQTVTLQPVQIGAYGTTTVPVTGGISANTWVVAAGGHLLRENQPIHAIDNKNQPIFSAMGESKSAAEISPPTENKPSAETISSTETISPTETTSSAETGSPTETISPTKTQPSAESPAPTETTSPSPTTKGD